jgi:hypothetical protein
MFMKQKCPFCTKKSISLFQKWKKFHFDNSFSSCGNCKNKWKINSKYKAVARWCFICYGVLLFLPYFIFNNYIIGLLSHNTQNIIYVIYNLFILIIPAILVEILILLILPLECQTNIENEKT